MKTHFNSDDFLLKVASANSLKTATTLEVESTSEQLEKEYTALANSSEPCNKSTMQKTYRENSQAFKKPLNPNYINLAEMFKK